MSAAQGSRPKLARRNFVYGVFDTHPPDALDIERHEALIGGIDPRSSCNVGRIQWPAFDVLRQVAFFVQLRAMGIVFEKGTRWFRLGIEEPVDRRSSEGGER